MIPETPDIQNPILPLDLRKQSGAQFVSNSLSVIVTIIFIIGIIAFIFMLLIGAVQWITSSGDKNSVESARNKITSGFVGLILLFVAFAIIKAAEQVFGVNLLLIDLSAISLLN